MGIFLLLVSLLCIAAGTWQLIGLIKADEPPPPGSKPLWIIITGIGVVLFFLLKIFADPM
ncbi:hypothetical protein ACTID9_04145 [Brevibacillus fluminis]|uniref:hypothetical protein n=1 Tax=Brevibacillus fluminis TaxID=511487 RepID=UPI003F8AA7C2